MTSSLHLTYDDPYQDQVDHKPQDAGGGVGHKEDKSEESLELLSFLVHIPLQNIL